MQRYRPARGPRARLVLLVASIVLTSLALLVGTALARDPSPTMGTIPREAIQDGKVDLSLVPDYIVALGRDGNPVGYVSREQALGSSSDQVDKAGRPMAIAVPVFTSDLKTVVGYMYPGRGFVPVGSDPQSVPQLTVEQGPAQP